MCDIRAFSRSFGTHAMPIFKPGVETPGYFQLSLREQSVRDLRMAKSEIVFGRIPAL